MSFGLTNSEGNHLSSPGAAQQVLMNLMLNGIEAMKDSAAN